MNDGADPDSTGRAGMLDLGPGIPVHVGERGIVSECAIGPCRVLRTEEVGEPCLGLRVVDALETATGDPNVIRDSVLVGGQCRVACSRFAEGDGTAGPNGGRAAAQRPGQRGQAKAYKYVISVRFHFAHFFFDRFRKSGNRLIPYMRNNWWICSRISFLGEIVAGRLNTTFIPTPIPVRHLFFSRTL